MVVCVIALVVFAVLGIVSSSHRQLAKEAFDCVFRRMTLRKCTTGFDNKMKMRVTTGLLKCSKALGSFVFKYFELISWIFTVAMFVSFALFAIGIYNYVAFGNCNGPNSTDGCILPPFSGIVQQPAFTAATCPSSPCMQPGCECALGDSNCASPENFIPCDANCFSSINSGG
ncbi:MAG: hypothetical protein V1494_03590 [Candidatus Diapherotrites archaeon]